MGVIQNSVNQALTLAGIAARDAQKTANENLNAAKVGVNQEIAKAYKTQDRFNEDIALHNEYADVVGEMGRYAKNDVNFSQYAPLNDSRMKSLIGAKKEMGNLEASKEAISNSFDPMIEKHNQMVQDEMAFNERIRGNPETPSIFADKMQHESSELHNFEYSPKHYEFTQKLKKQLIERQQSAMSKVEEVKAAKQNQRRNFMQYLAKQPLSLGGEQFGTVGDMPKQAQKLWASQYNANQRKAMMDRMDKENK